MSACVSNSICPTIGESGHMFDRVEVCASCLMSPGTRRLEDVCAEMCTTGGSSSRILELVDGKGTPPDETKAVLSMLMVRCSGGVRVRQVDLVFLEKLTLVFFFCLDSRPPKESPALCPPDATDPVSLSEETASERFLPVRAAICLAWVFTILVRSLNLG